MAAAGSREIRLRESGGATRPGPGAFGRLARPGRRRRSECFFNEMAPKVARICRMARERPKRLIWQQFTICATWPGRRSLGARRRASRPEIGNICSRPIVGPSSCCIWAPARGRRRGPARLGRACWRRPRALSLSIGPFKSRSPAGAANWAAQRAHPNHHRPPTFAPIHPGDKEATKFGL